MSIDTGLEPRGPQPVNAIDKTKITKRSGRIKIEIRAASDHRPVVKRIKMT